jgi:hypothetical protein
MDAGLPMTTNQTDADREESELPDAGKTGASFSTMAVVNNESAEQPAEFPNIWKRFKGAPSTSSNNSVNANLPKKQVNSIIQSPTISSMPSSHLISKVHSTSSETSKAEVFKPKQDPRLSQEVHPQPPRKRDLPNRSCRNESHQMKALKVAHAQAEEAPSELIQPQATRKRGQPKESCSNESQSLAPAMESTSDAQFQTGDLVMAKMPNFPYWPAIFLKKGHQKSERSKVMFWDFKVQKIVLSTAEIKTSKVTLYKSSEEAKEAFKKGPRFKLEFAFADELQTLSAKEAPPIVPGQVYQTLPRDPF